MEGLKSLYELLDSLNVKRLWPRIVDHDWDWIPDYLMLWVIIPPMLIEELHAITFSLGRENGSFAFFAFAPY